MAAALALPGPLTAGEATRDLGGLKEGCPMKLLYDPAVLIIDPEGARIFAGQAGPPTDETTPLGIGSFKDLRSGRVWRLLSSHGLSCNPYFLFVSSGPGGMERANISGEILHLASTAGFSIQQTSNLYFKIERRFRWENGRPVEKIPEFYPVQKRTKTLKKLALFREKTAAVTKGWLTAGTELEISGYFPKRSGADRALVRATDGRIGWVDLGPGAMNGVASRGDRPAPPYTALFETIRVGGYPEAEGFGRLQVP